MGKKVSPKLINTDQVIYAVLSEGNGYLKELYGEAHFVDNLPRASGCFVDKVSAIAAAQRALALTRKEVEEAEKKLTEAGTVLPTVRSAHMYFINRARAKFKMPRKRLWSKFPFEELFKDLQVLDGLFEILNLVLKHSKAQIAITTQKTSNLFCIVAMIDTKGT